MASSQDNYPGRFIVDSIHGDIHLTKREWKVVDTASFQRLRHIKQLQMGQVTYPNATHTRFVHCLGTLHIMQRVLKAAKEHGINLDGDERENLRLAALLHDVGHYPYSHLLEGVDKVDLLEERVKPPEADKKQTLDLERKAIPYPSHVSVGGLVVTRQPDMLAAIGGEAKAKKVAALFSGEEIENKKMSRLISSSWDLDRFDYLQRDSYATGLPYGRIDLNYLLNSLRGNSEGEIGVHERAIPAVEHFLMARYFMHRTVYYHRTTWAIEEACRQLLRRLRDGEKYGVPEDGQQIKEIVTSRNIHTFTDSYVDAIVRQAISDPDDVIGSLAWSIQSRNPPKLLKEVSVFSEKAETLHRGTVFRERCLRDLAGVAHQKEIALGRFLLCELPPITVEKAVSRYTASEYRQASSEALRQSIRDENEIVKVFEEGSDNPKSLLEIDQSIVKKLAGQVFRTYRLYFVPSKKEKTSPVEDLRALVADWDRP
ncbi:MAG: HD domain-containing protein [Sedimentisphaerales bacterium]|nr:HD domain-containing protein [Sedimentisphaerales bacterium]